MVYDLFRNFAPEIQVQSYSACSFGHPISGTKLHSLFLFGTRFRVQSYIPCFFLALESGSLGLKGKK
jgi:hypothetical protein